MGFSRQEHWSGLPCPPLGNLPNPGIEPRSPTLQADSLPTEPPGKPQKVFVWQNLGLNQGPLGLQSNSLPTELFWFHPACNQDPTDQTAVPWEEQKEAPSVKLLSAEAANQLEAQVNLSSCFLPSKTYWVSTLMPGLSPFIPTPWNASPAEVSGWQCMCGYVLGHCSRVRLFVTLWTTAHQAPPSMGSSRQEYWSGLPCPPPGDLPDPGIEPLSLTSLLWQAGSFTTVTSWEGSVYITANSHTHRVQAHNLNVC